MSNTPAPHIKGVHHSAFRCRDAEETRAFYEGILGLPLKAALTFDKDPGGQDRPYMHLFFEMGDSNYIAFFDMPHTVDEKKFKIRDGMEEYHVAMEVGSMSDLQAFKRRLEDAKVPVFGPINHHFCHSIYFFDPNGINLEFTVRDTKHDAIMAAEAAHVEQLMHDWKDRMGPLRSDRLKGTEADRKATEDFKAVIARAAQSMIDRVHHDSPQ